MNRRTIGIAMLVVEAAFLWRTMGYLPIAILAILVALLGSWPSLQVNWGYRKKYVAAAAVGTVYLGWWWMDLQYLERPWSGQFGRNTALASALCLMMLQAQQYYWRSPRGLPGYYAILAVLSMAFAADRYLGNRTEHLISFSLAMALGVLICVFYSLDGGERGRDVSSSRRRRYVLLGICFLLSALLAGGTAWAIGNSDRAIAQWMAHRMGNRLTLGNQTTARLNSMTDIQGKNFDHIALQIVAKTSPGYLRGQVYDKYNGLSWSALARGSAVTPVAHGPEGYVPLWSAESLYPVIPEAGGMMESLVVYPDAAIDRALFAPKETGWVGRSSGAVMLNEAQVVQATSAMLGQPYQILTTATAPLHPLSAEERLRYTQLPPKLEARLKTLAVSIGGEQSTTLGKANAIAQYFTANYDYVIGIEVPRGMNPMVYFLFSDPLPDAHCEFFATGAALLLRALGVPTRYVTGVGVWEQHPFADYWIARNRDAHAWVEAWDDEEGWFIVEATPASGLPEASRDQGTNRFRDFWSMIVLSVKRLIAALKEGASSAVADVLRALLLGVTDFVRTAWWIVLLLIAVGLALWKLFRRLRRGREEASTSSDVYMRRMQTQLSIMDRWVRKEHRLTRRAHVTLHAFARELEETLPEEGESRSLADWYRQWAIARYRPEVEAMKIEALETDSKLLRRKGS